MTKQNSLPVVICAQHFQRVSAARSSGGTDEKYNSSVEPATASYSDNLIPVHTAISCFSNIQFAILLSFTHTHTHTHFLQTVFFTVEIFHLDFCGRLVICPMHYLYSTPPIISVITLIMQGNDDT